MTDPDPTPWWIRAEKDIYRHPGEIQSNKLVYSVPAWLGECEKTMLYALIRGLEPKRILEIGTYRGGSAAIMASALDDSGLDGKIVTLDPDPKITPELMEQIKHRVTLLPKGSPDAIPEARQLLGGKFDFCFLDANHQREFVTRDLLGVIPYLETGAILLMHDAHYQDVKDAVAMVLTMSPGTLLNFGILTKQVCVPPEEPGKFYAGLGLLRRL